MCGYAVLFVLRLRFHRVPNSMCIYMQKHIYIYIYMWLYWDVLLDVWLHRLGFASIEAPSRPLLVRSAVASCVQLAVQPAAQE